MKNVFFFFLIFLLATSCVPHKKVVYFDDMKEGGALNMPDPPEIYLKPADLVEVNITSISQETNAYFLKSGATSEGKYAPNVYQIAGDGTIDIPLIGKVALSGKTAEESQEHLRELLLEYLQKPSVNVRLVSFRITILGEVKAPGVYEIPDSRVSVLEAIGRAGDLTIFGKRDNVLLIRNIGDEKRSFRIDLNKSDLLNNELFYLQNNDVLYIEPSRGKTAGDDNVYRLLPLVLSGLTFVAVIISLTQ